MGHGVVPLLLTAIGGYWVLERAETHKGQLKQVGQFLGALVIIASLVGAACRVWSLAMGKSAYCPMHKSWHGSYGSKMMPPEVPVR